MIRTTLLVAACMATLGAAAQETVTMDLPKEEKERKNELGLLGEVPVGSSSNFYYGGGRYEGRIGAQYKRWVKPNKAYRVSIGYGDYLEHNNKAYMGTNGDTMFQSFYRNRVPVFFGSAGLEIQRQFYKRIHFYAAVDLQVGYGKGQNEHVKVTEVLNNNNYYDHSYYNETITATSSATLFNVALMPYVGAKFLFNRISFGMELSGIRMEYVSVTSPPQPMNGAIGSFNVGDIRQRVFICYRF